MNSKHPDMSTEKKSPTDFVKYVYGRPVEVKLYNGIIYKGILNCLDGFLNVVLEQAEEFEDGELTNRYNDCFIRGNNSNGYVLDYYVVVLYIAPNDEA